QSIVRRMVNARLAIAVVVAAIAVAAPAARALDIGIADQQASSFGDPRLAGLGLRYARLIVPWDAAASEPATVQAWLDAVAADGMQPHIAFEHLLHQKCPSRSCYAPTQAQYAAAVHRLI